MKVIPMWILVLFVYKELCCDGTDFPVQSQFRYWSLGSCGSRMPVLVLGSGSYFSIPGFRYKVFMGLLAFFFILALVWFHFGSILAPFRLHFGSILALLQLQIRWNLKLWYWNLSWLEPWLLKIFSTKIKKLPFFLYYWFYTNARWLTY